MKKTILLVLLITGSLSFIYADIHLPSIISDNMVLQRNSQARIWGKTDTGSLLKITTGWNGKEYKVSVDKEGKWELFVETTEAGGPYNMTIESKKEKKVLQNIFLGDVWICSGQSNTEMPVKGFTGQPVENSIDAIIESQSYPSIHMYTAKQTPALTPQEDVAGQWEQASVSTTGDFSAIGYFFAKTLQDVLKIPIGIVHFSWGGSSIETWMSKENLKKYDHIDLSNIEIHPQVPQQIPTLLYNGMLLPVVNYSVKGFIWYQGESNIPVYQHYTSLFTDLVSEWRDLFGGGEELPFYFVQIAPFQYDDPMKRESAYLREAQMKCLDAVPNTGMAVTLDAGELQCIHPAKKEIVGKRLAYQALNKAYNYENIPCDGPVMSDIEIKEDKLIVSFKNAEHGLYPMFVELEGFEVAGEDKKYFPAKAVVTNFWNKIEVSSIEVERPRYVRYGFRNYVKGSLYNAYGLPAGSFRSDK